MGGDNVWVIDLRGSIAVMKPESALKYPGMDIRVLKELEKTVGESFTWFFTGRYATPLMCDAYRDLEERKKLDEAKREVEKLMDAIIDARRMLIKDGILYVDTDHYYIDLAIDKVCKGWLEREENGT